MYYRVHDMKSMQFICCRYLMSGNAEYRGMVWQIAEDYACADLLLRLPGHCPMPVRPLPQKTSQNPKC